MTYPFYAEEMDNREDIVGIPWDSHCLNREVVLWLSKNLRKRPTDSGRRYHYMKSYLPTVTIAVYKLSNIRTVYNIGVLIYDEEDAMAFKLRWS